MGKYGNAAVKATQLYREGSASSPNKAWEIAVREIFSSTSSQNKSCPRDAYLGLCESGVISGIPANGYCRSGRKLNKSYALKALSLLKQDSTLLHNEKALWHFVMKGGDDESKTYNNQMDVVISMWDAGYVK